MTNLKFDIKAEQKEMENIDVFAADERRLISAIMTKTINSQAALDMSMIFPDAIRMPFIEYIYKNIIELSKAEFLREEYSKNECAVCGN